MNGMRQTDLTLSSRDFWAIAALHMHAIPAGFLSSLGVGFLARLYKGIAAAPQSCVLAERDEQDTIIGFVAGTLDIRKCYKHVLLRNFISLGIAMVPRLLSAGTIQKIFETILYATKNAPLKKDGQEGDKVKGVRPELLSIAVADSGQGKGIGRKLVQRLEQFFQGHGFRGEYKVVTAAKDPRSNAFYARTGFILHHGFMHHGNAMHEYRKELG